MLHPQVPGVFLAKWDSGGGEEEEDHEWIIFGECLKINPYYCGAGQEEQEDRVWDIGLVGIASSTSAAAAV